jgi:hypothetical protein
MGSYNSANTPFISPFQSVVRLMTKRLWWPVWILFLASMQARALADDSTERAITLIDRVHFTGEIKRVFMVVTTGRTVLESKQVAWIEQPEAKEIACIGQVALKGDEAVLHVLFVVFGERGEVRSSFKTVNPNEISPTQFLSSSELRDRLIERRGALRQLQTEVRLQDERLDSLQADADAIANVAKIVSAEDELKELQADIKKIDAAFASMQQRIAQMKARPAPLNAQKREAELVRQLGALTTALTATETTALKGISAASAELKQKLQLIEETSDEHVVLLEDELAELQRRQR